MTALTNLWRARNSDAKFADIPAMLTNAREYRSGTAEKVVSSAKISTVPVKRGGGLQCVGPNGQPVAFTHWSFSQLAASIKAPADYLRHIPAELAADCVNYGLRFSLGSARDFGVLLHRGDEFNTLDAWTGPRYGRVWNDDVLATLVDNFGDGLSDRWRVPEAMRSSALSLSDRDMFVFLTDDRNKVEVPNRRGGRPGLLSRGFYLWNSQVGSKTIGVGAFLYDYICGNRMVMGMRDFQSLTIRHTVSAPDRWVDEVVPLLTEFANGSVRGITETIEAARNKKVTGDLADFLANRFGKKMADRMLVTHLNEEDRPIETIWDISVAATAVARSIEHQDKRVAFEEEAGKVLALAA